MTVCAAPAILISRMLPDEAVRRARSRARVDIHNGEAPLRKPELTARLNASHDTRLKMATLAVDNCLAVLEGKMPPTAVNPEVVPARGK